MPKRSPDALVSLLRSKKVAELGDLRHALDGASRATVFRYLARVPYRRSYSHNGRYYSLHDPGRYDRHGLWSHGDVHFSREGSLKATVRRLVEDSDSGRTRRELRALLRTRVQPSLLAAARAGDLHRQAVAGVYLYLHIEPTSRAEQLGHRQQQTEVGEEAVCDAVVIEVLLVLIRHLGATPSDVLRVLRGRSPPVGIEQVRAVFSRYDLGEKGGSSSC